MNEGLLNGIKMDVEETIEYCKHRLGNTLEWDDIYEQLQRTNENLKLIVTELMKEEDESPN